MKAYGRMENKVCIITGASGGIGKGIASVLAKEKAQVIIADILEKEGGETAEIIKSNGGIAAFFKHDVTSEDSWKAVVEYALKTYKKLDVLVNNAGIAFSKMLVDMTVQEFRMVMSVNVEGVFLGIKHAATAMKKNKAQGGSIINISSNYIFIPSKTQTAYCASKSAIGSITRVAAIEFAEDKIRVNTIYPGFVNTPMFDSVCSKFGKSKEEMLSVMARSVLSGRVGEPVDIANAVLFLASDESQFITGADLTVDGGEVIKRTFYDDLEKMMKQS